MLPSVLPKLGTDSAVRRFPGVWKLLVTGGGRFAAGYLCLVLCSVRGLVVS